MTFRIGTHEFTSRLIVGTGKYPDFACMREALDATGAELITVALRRINLDAPKGEGLLDYIDRDRYRLLPNTAGCFTAQDAILTARLAREALGTDLIKLEVIGDPKTLFPDNEATLEAARVLVDDGFTVMPYCIDDPIVCRKLVDLGCPVVMPLAAPIGSGLGIRNSTNLRIILETVDVPVIVDAGVGTASDAAVAMELGCSAILMNTAIAGAKDPIKMAHAMRHAVAGGRLAYEAGRIPKKLYATASSPSEGLIEFAGE
jgi:thiazole synthase